jgi:hypothetical protein
MAPVSFPGIPFDILMRVFLIREQPRIIDAQRAGTAMGDDNPYSGAPPWRAAAFSAQNQSERKRPTAVKQKSAAISRQNQSDAKRPKAAAISGQNESGRKMPTTLKQAKQVRLLTHLTTGNKGGQLHNKIWHQIIRDPAISTREIQQALAAQNIHVAAWRVNAVAEGFRTTVRVLRDAGLLKPGFVIKRARA